MRHSRGFILAEILTGMMLQASFVVVLCGTFYMMLTFYSRTHQVLSAGQNGERVITYVEQRIQSVGVGMWECRKPGDIINAMNPLTLKNGSDVRPLHGLCLPVSVSWDNTVHSTDTVIDNTTHKIIKYRGNVLTLIYAEREMYKDAVLTTYDSGTLDKNYYKKSFVLLNSEKAATSKFTNNNPSAPAQDIRMWTVMQSSGLPMYLYEKPENNSPITLGVSSNIPRSVDIHPISELLYLRGEKMFVDNDTTATGAAKNFRYQTLTNDWGREESYQASILEIYFVLHTEADTESPRTLDLYVLSSGGTNSSGNTEKPKDWPGKWNDSEYSKHTVYVSRASWKLHNLANFSWN